MMAENFLSRRDKALFALLVLAACAVVYANGTIGAFTYDDKAIVRDNPRIRSPQTVGQLFAREYFGGPRGTGSTYRPALLLSFAVQWWIHGKDVVAFHVVNVALHAAATLALAALLLRVGVSPPASAAAALLFAVHPIHVEAVTSLVGRGEVQSALFTLLYLHAALFLRRGSRLAALGLAVTAYAAAVLTKESGAVAPALAFLLLAFVAQGSLPRRLWGALVRGFPLFILSAAVLVGVFRLRAWVLGGSLRSGSSGIFEVENALAPLGPAARMVNAGVIFFRYLGRCAFPLHLSADESAWSIRPLPVLSPLAIAAVLLLVLLTVTALARLSQGSAPALGFLFFALALLPTGNVLFPIGTIFAERLAYLPSAGICLIGGALLAGSASGSLSRSSARGRVFVAVAVLLSVRTIVRNAAWWTDEGLFANLISTAPRSAKAHYDLAYVEADLGRDRLARSEYQKAIALYGEYWDAWAGKGRVEKRMGLLGEAERSYEKSLQIFPDYENGHFGLGSVREAKGDDEGAEDTYREGLEKKPRSIPLAYHLALVSARLDLESAPADWRRAVELGGDLCSVRGDYAQWCLDQGEVERARGEALRAVRRSSACVEGLRVLAAAAERKGQDMAAALAFEQAYRVSRSREDLAALMRAAQACPAYAPRLAALRRAGTIRDDPSVPPTTR